jgi:hypothetical protein
VAPQQLQAAGWHVRAAAGGAAQAAAAAAAGTGVAR